MRSRFLFVASVVGALLIGGATTGGTGASWVDTNAMATGGMQAGRIGFKHDESKASFSLNKTTATSDTVEVTVTDQSLGKNLVQRITPTVTPGAGLSGAVARTKASGACTLTTQSAVSLSPSGTFTMCVVATVDANTALTSSTVTVSLASQQMRGTSAAGWSAPTQTYTIPVSIAQPTAPDAPTFTCASGSATTANLTFSWSSQAGDKFELLRKRTGDSGFISQFTNSTQTSYSQAQSGANAAGNGEAWSYKVKVTRNGLVSGDSKTLTLTRSGNSDNYNCVVQ